jgi:hypothetical protein
MLDMIYFQFLLFMLCMIEIYLLVWDFDVYGLFDWLFTEGFQFMLWWFISASLFMVRYAVEI